MEASTGVFLVLSVILICAAMTAHILHSIRKDSYKEFLRNRIELIDKRGSND